MFANRKKHASVWRVAKGLSSVLLGPMLGTKFIKRRVLAPEIRNSARTSLAVKSYQSRFSNRATDYGDESSPVFIFSAGWGSGSTLLQRLLISSGEAVIWGEPVDEACPIHRLCQMIDPVRADWPPDSHFRDNTDPDHLASEWIANYSPDMASYQLAHKEFLRHWLSDNGKNKRWGLKEVRLTIDHAIYLKWLFPNAKFLFIYRDLEASYLSIRRKPWFSVWPNHSATDIVSFAHHWRHLLSGYIDRYQEVDGMLIKFEDLVSGKISPDVIAEYAGLSSLDTAILDKKVGSRSVKRKPLILPERLILHSVAGKLRKQLGY